jgi:hypothetical protein
MIEAQWWFYRIAMYDIVQMLVKTLVQPSTGWFFKHGKMAKLLIHKGFQESRQYFEGRL